MVWGVVRQLFAGLACMLLVGGASGAAAVSGEVVLGDAYPPRHIGFPGGVTGFPISFTRQCLAFGHCISTSIDPRTDLTKHYIRLLCMYTAAGGWAATHASPAHSPAGPMCSQRLRRGVTWWPPSNIGSAAKPAFRLPQQDVKAAIRWLRSQASTYHIDKTRGLIWGASAGGQLAALTATSCGVAALDPVGAPRGI